MALQPEAEQEVDLILPHRASLACTPVGVANLGLDVQAASPETRAHANGGIDIPLRSFGGAQRKAAGAQWVAAEDAIRPIACDRGAAHGRACRQERPPAVSLVEEPELRQDRHFQRAATRGSITKSDRVLA